MPKRRSFIVVLMLGCIALGTLAATAQVSIDGIEFVDHGKVGTIELGGFRGGLGVLDYDGDGYPDLLINDNCGELPRLFHNEPDPDRPDERTFVDRTAGSGLDDPEGIARRSDGALVADYDNDGDHDVFLLGRLCGTFSIGLLYRNDDGTFTNVSVASGVRAEPYRPESASWTDFDLDGHVDLFCIGDEATGGRALLLHNQGNGTFANASHLLPAAGGSSHAYSHLWTDVDDDGYADCLAIWTGPRVLKNVASPGGGRQFVDAEDAIGFTAIGPGPMGIAAGDIDGDLDFDIAVSNAAIGTYFENQGGTFEPIFPFETFFAWGVTWIDVDNDGDLDHYHAGSYASPNRDLLFRNTDGVWDDISPALNAALASTRYAAQLDYDNDGRRDIVAVNPDDFVSVYQNISSTANHAFTIVLEGDGDRVNGSAVGALVTITAGGATQVAEMRSGSSTTSTEDLRPHFGLGAATSVDSVVVRWPRRGSLASRTETFEGPFDADSIVTLRPGCPEDVDRDGDVGFSDLTSVIATWGPCADCVADLDGDGKVGFTDLVAVLARWQTCG